MDDRSAYDELGRSLRRWTIADYNRLGTGTTNREYKKGAYLTTNRRQLDPGNSDNDALRELAARHGWTYASDEEREATVQRLRDAGSDGRLTAEEMGGLIAEALRARTRERLEILLKGLPARVQPGNPRARGSKVAFRLSSTYFFIGVVIVTGLVWITSILVLLALSLFGLFGFV